MSIYFESISIKKVVRVEQRTFVMDPKTVSRSHKFLTKFINYKLRYEDRVKLLNNASEQNIQCILQIINNSDKLSIRGFNKCKRSLNVLKSTICNDLGITKKYLCMHVPAIRATIAAALLDLMHYELNLIIGPPGLVISGFDIWNN